MRKSFTYKKAGIDINMADKAKSRIKSIVRKTFTKGVLSDIGKFGGFFKFDYKKYKSPVLVSSVDGVGTKLKIASLLKKYDTVGLDLVSHCANDILVHGAKPLFFLDYIAMAKTEPKVISEIVKGLATACKFERCALIGGETAQMPDIYKKDDFDLVGLVVGVVEKSKIIDGRNIKAGDKIIGLPSNGLHTNGYTLARKLLLEKAGYKINEFIPELKTTLGQELLKPHKSYSKVIFRLMERFTIKGIAHITGGGFLDNIPRILPKNLSVVIKKDSWKVLPIFNLIRKLGNLNDTEMFRTFNMGLGMVVFVSDKDSGQILNYLKRTKEESYEIGEVVKFKKGMNKVIL
ncbi:MAG: phosphoribosylformylglycinamidine cyclo-ligase [Candidatus Firestonebacteria bacterium]